MNGRGPLSKLPAQRSQVAMKATAGAGYRGQVTCKSALPCSSFFLFVGCLAAAWTQIGPVPVQLPFVDQPIDGWTFALSMMGLFLAVVAFGVFQVWRLMFSTSARLGASFDAFGPGCFCSQLSSGDELGSYEEIKWGGARPPKEYIEEQKRLEACYEKLLMSIQRRETATGLPPTEWVSWVCLSLHCAAQARRKRRYLDLKSVSTTE